MDKLSNNLNSALDNQDFFSESFSQDIVYQIPKITLQCGCDNNFKSSNEQRNYEDISLNNSCNLSLKSKLFDSIEFKTCEKPTNLGTNEQKPNKNENDRIYFNLKETKFKKFFKIEDIEKNSLKSRKKLLGRKRNIKLNINSKIDISENRISKEEHNKFSDDNLRKKIKYLVLNSTMKYINITIEKIYKGNIGNNIFKKKLLTINKDQISNAKIEFNQNFLYKNLGDIFSDPISSKFTNYSSNHNELLIKSLKNEKDKNKQNFFNKIFNLTFLQCLEHFRGTVSLDILNGIVCFDKIKENYADEIEYLHLLEYYINNYEKIIMRKKPRISRLNNGK